MFALINFSLILQLDDVAENYLPPRSSNNNDSGRAGNGSQGFYVKGAPWDAGSQSAPNTEDTEEFPSMGLPSASGDEPSTPWGPRYVSNSRK